MEQEKAPHRTESAAANFSQPSQRAQSLQEMLRGGEGERLEELKKTMRTLIIAGSSAEAILHSLERIQHDAVSGDDTDYKYENVLEEVNEVNQRLAALPEQIKI